MASAEKPVRFGAFQFDFRSHQLTRRGHRVRLPASQIRLLLLFLERPGELITRDDIARRLWSETAMVDVERGINTAINRLRATLRDSPAEPEFMETVIGLGYRFVATIEVEADDPPVEDETTPAPLEEPLTAQITASAQTPEIPAAEAAPPSAQRTYTRRAVWWWATAAALLLLVTGSFAVWKHRRNASVATQTRTPHQPPFFPVTFNPPENSVTTQAMLPDGSGLAYADNSGISLHWFDGRPERLLASMPDLSVSRISIIGNGTEMLVSGLDRSTSQHQVWVVPQQGAYPHRLAAGAELAVASPDGQSFAYLTPDGSAAWIGALADGRARRLRSADEGRGYNAVLWSADSRRLFLASGPTAPVHNPCPLAGQAPASGPPTAVAADWALEVVDASSGSVLDRQNAPRLDDGYMRADNSLIYLSNPSDIGPAGRAELISWTVDPASGRFLGKPQVERTLPGTCAWGLSAGTGILGVVLTRTTQQVQIATFDGQSITSATRLTNSPYDAYPHSWTPDGRVVFETGSNGRLSIFEQAPPDSGPRPLAVLPQDVAMPQTSPDGKSVLFLQLAGHPQHPSGIFRVPLAGGAPEQVPTTGDIEEFHCPRDPHAVCVLREAQGRDKLLYFAMDPVKGMGKLLASTPWEANRLGDWGISPDGALVAATSHDSQNPRLHLIALQTGKVTELPLPDHGELLGATWDPGRRGLFLECKTGKGYRLTFRDFSGHETLLRESPLLVWAVPSVDGRQLALPSPSTTTNVWAVGKTP